MGWDAENHVFHDVVRLQDAERHGDVLTAWDTEKHVFCDVLAARDAEKHAFYGVLTDWEASTEPIEVPAGHPRINMDVLEGSMRKTS